MSTLLLVARLLLAAVFVVAGLAKLADLPGSRRAVRDFGLPVSVAAGVGMMLPLAELATAVALIPVGTARFGGLGALALLVAFMVAIARSMARGEQPDCHCFGQLHSAPAGPGTLIRNAWLAGVAGFVVIVGWSDSGASATGWLGSLSSQELLVVIAGLVNLALLCVVGLFSWQLLRQNGRLLLRLEALEGAVGLGSSDVPHGLAVGSEAPAFSLPDLDGERVALADLVDRRRAVMLLFSDPACGPCSALMPAIGRWQREHAHVISVAVVSRGTADENRASARDHGVGDLLLQDDREIAEAYRASGTPSAVLIDIHGRIASDPALGVLRVEALMQQIVASRQTAGPRSEHSPLSPLEIIQS